MKTRLAFTLVELLMVIVILSIILSLSLPNFSKSFNHLELKKTTDDIVYLIRWAQTRAINDNLEYQLIFGNDRQSYRILRQSGNEEHSRKKFVPVAIQMGRLFRIPQSVKVIDSKDMHIYPDGTLDKIQIRLQGKNASLIISSMEQRGHVFIYDET